MKRFPHRILCLVLACAYVAIAVGCQYHATDPETGQRREISREEYRQYTGK